MHDRRFLAKSFKSALVMAIILITPIYLLLWALELLGRGPSDTFDTMVQTGAAMCGALLLVTLVITLPAAVAIYRLDDRHFGLQAFWRWLAMGFLLGLGLAGLSMIIPSRQPGDTAVLATVRWMARTALSGGVLYLSYWLTFKMPLWAARDEGREVEEQSPAVTKEDDL